MKLLNALKKLFKKDKAIPEAIDIKKAEYKVEREAEQAKQSKFDAAISFGTTVSVLSLGALLVRSIQYNRSADTPVLPDMQPSNRVQLALL